MVAESERSQRAREGGGESVRESDTGRERARESETGGVCVKTWGDGVMGRES